METMLQPYVFASISNAGADNNGSSRVFFINIVGNLSVLKTRTVRPSKVQVN